jgi:hypothetical protein
MIRLAAPSTSRPTRSGHAVDFLIDHISGRIGPEKIELEANVIIRQSTGPARAAAQSRRPRQSI